MPFPMRALVLAGAALFLAGAAEAGSLALAVGQVHREPTPGTVANVVVADPTVADVTVVDPHSVIILGKGVGATEILAMDRAGHVLIDDQVVIGGAREEGRVTLFRGAEASDYACSPRCAALGAGAAGGGAGVASTTTTTSGSGSGYQSPPVAPPVTTTTTQTATQAHP